MAKKPLRVFKTSTGKHPAAKGKHPTESQLPVMRNPVHVYRDGEPDADRRHITQQVIEYPVDHVKRTTSLHGTDYEALLHSIYDSVLVTQTDGKIIEVNARAEYGFMFSAADLQQMNIVDLISGADQELLNVLRRNVDERRFTVLEAVCMRADQTRFHAEIVVNRIKVKGFSNLCFFIRDVTDRKQAEEELKRANEKLVEAERLQARLDTLATLFHELNNPMQIMMCMAELDNNAEYRKQLNRIMSVMEQLRKEDSLEPIVDETGTSRYVIAVEKNLEECNPSSLLVVDDEEVLRKMFVSAVKTAIPYLQIDAAGDGRQALELFAANHHGVIIMDVAMPELGGEEAFREIEAVCARKKWRMPRFIFCTGFMVSDKLQEVIDDGSVHTCLRKPLTMSDLVTSVQNHLTLTTTLEKK